MRRFLGASRFGVFAAVVLLTLAACADDVGILTSPPDAGLLDPDDYVRSLAPPPNDVFNRYIVVLNSNAPPLTNAVAELTRVFGGYPFYAYESIGGYAVANLPSPSVEGLRHHPWVELIEEDREVSPGLVSQDLTIPSAYISYWWGLDRIDQDAAARDYQYRFQYGGSGSHIYVLDTGIRGTHSAFTGRLGEGVTKILLSWHADPYIDQGGHGTAVASVAAGTKAGVAKNAWLHSVRINDNGAAWTSDINEGLEWVAEHAIKPAVANLSYKTTSISTLWLVNDVINAGVSFVQAAGNDTTQANYASQTAASNIVVAATDSSDDRATFSNYGPLVDVFAPGATVLVASIAGDNLMGFASGTSLAAPFVAGTIAALFDQMGDLPPGTVEEIVQKSAVVGLVGDPQGSPNRLLASSFASVEIAGLTYVPYYLGTTQATYAANVTGGNGYSYLWEESVNGGGWQTVSTSSSYVHYFVASEDYLNIRLTGTTFGGSVQRTDQVYVDVDQGSCPPPQLECDA